MYAKQYSNLSLFFFFIILHFAPLISSINSASYNGESDEQLSYGYYDRSCPSLEMVVSLGVWKAIRNDSRMAASLLRLHSQDCLVNGCDASLLLDDTQTFKGEQSALPNQYSIRGLDVIDQIKEVVELVCPSTVSCADILALAARDAVVQSRGPFWQVQLGRLDGLYASKESVMEQLPSPFEPLKNITAKFYTKGLNIKDVVVLSGAHTLGSAQCYMFRDRLYNYKNSSKPDPSLNPSLLSKLQSICTTNDKTSCNLAALDSGSANVFDNSYYKNLMKNYGLLQSDQALMSHPTTVPMVERYSANLPLFLNDFAASMTKLGKIGVITNGGGGEIRIKCGYVN
ncbi:hypothetical protein CASFOL_004794 [Castilleja foliolosa]|uniref:Peroxidase n=1 Tax=Castilleja foliolosa TaxID=1961234 RepID=A0ABD3EBX5_9LAMI